MVQRIRRRRSRRSVKRRVVTPVVAPAPVKVVTAPRIVRMPVRRIIPKPTTRISRQVQAQTRFARRRVVTPVRRDVRPKIIRFARRFTTKKQRRKRR